MPPRYAYWTIIVDGQPTAFRSGSLEDIQPTFNRLKARNPTAELKWWQNNQLWPTRKDAQEFMLARGARGRARDPRQASGDRPERAWNAKPDWKTRSSFKPREDKPSFAKATEGKPAWKPKGDAGGKPEWKPKGTFKPKEAGHASGWGEKPGMKAKDNDAPAYAKATARQASGEKGGKPEWKPKGSFAPHRPEWKPKSAGGSARDNARSSFRPKSYTPKVDDGMTRSSRVQSRNDKLEWQPKGSARPDGPNAGFKKSDPDAPKRKWVPKAEYKKSMGIEAKRDDKWRPGGEHVDPKQKYKDAKKAKWTKIKSTIRARSSNPRKKGST